MTGPIHQFDQGYGKANGAPLKVVSQPRRPLQAGEVPQVGVVYNPRSHRNKGQDLVAAGLPNVSIGLPHGRDQIAQVLAGFAEKGIDYLVINGGDGTVRDVLTCGQSVFGENWPELAFLPKGKTNALNVDLGAPSDWTLAQAITAFGSGRRIERRPLEIVALGGSETVVRGFILGGGAFTTAVKTGQDAHRMGAFNSLAVAVTSVWGVGQALFGSDGNQWRRGTEMEITLSPDAIPLLRSKYGKAERRALILASTLGRFPMGVQIFGGSEAGLKLAVIDHPRRRLMVLLPAILAGYRPQWLPEAGIHQIAAEAFELTTADPFILDGEAFPGGRYRIEQGAPLSFVVP